MTYYEMNITLLLVGILVMLAVLIVLFIRLNSRLKTLTDSVTVFQEDASEKLAIGVKEFGEQDIQGEQPISDESENNFFSVEDLQGVYKVVGSNQGDHSNNSYNGYLELSLDPNRRIIAKWMIGGEQAQSGKGFYKDNLLIINFSYVGDETGAIFKGVVAYKFLNKNFLKGFWSEKHGDDRSLGYEECRRLENFEMDIINLN